jgi:hypothetical protein
LPGHSPGTLIIDGDLVLDQDGIVRIDIFGTMPGQYDILQITGELALNGTVEFRLREGMDSSVINEVPWLAVAGPTTGAFTETTITYVPEPTSVALLSLAGLLAVCRRAA